MIYFISDRADELNDRISLKNKDKKLSIRT